MKRFHVHVTVEDLTQSVRFYSTLFATEPTVLKPDYAKWMLEDPRVNFAISTGGGHGAGISHLGIQAEDQGELAEIYDRLAAAERPVLVDELAVVPRDPFQQVLGRTRLVASERGAGQVCRADFFGVDWHRSSNDMPLSGA